MVFVCDFENSLMNVLSMILYIEMFWKFLGSHGHKNQGGGHKEIDDFIKKRGGGHKEIDHFIKNWGADTKK